MTKYITKKMKCPYVEYYLECDMRKETRKQTLEEVLKDITIDGNNYKRAGWGELWDCIRETRDKLEQKIKELSK